MKYEIGEMGIIIAVLLVWWISISIKRMRKKEKWILPPGPKRFPLVGNLLQLGWEPHVSFAKLADKHGPIMTIWLGHMRTVIISSSEASREMFKNFDTVLAGRKIYESMTIGNFCKDGSLISSQYGPQWRFVRRLCTLELFVGSRLDASQSIRARSIDRMLKYVEEVCGSGVNNNNNVVDFQECFLLMAFNYIGNLIFSKDFDDPKLESGCKYYYHARKIIEITGKPNLADFFPILKWCDPQGIKRTTEYYARQLFEISEGLINERIKNREGGSVGEGKRKDFVDVLLDFRGDGVKEPSMLSSTFMNIIILEMFSAGTDTTSSTLEWAMAELLRNPSKLRKVQAEIRNNIVPNKKLEEKDIEQLPYLKAVIKETLRLHPPTPLLIPHRAMESCKMLGYDIPKETQILVNVWALARDPKTWKDPLEFKPERFLEPNLVDYKGHHFEYIPFGSGRRICPAMPLASRLLPFALGSILQSFDWVLADGIKPEDIDMTEKVGFTLRKSVPLKAIPIPFKEKLF